MPSSMLPVITNKNDEKIILIPMIVRSTKLKGKRINTINVTRPQRPIDVGFTTSLLYLDLLLTRWLPN